MKDTFNPARHFSLMIAAEKQKSERWIEGNTVISFLALNKILYDLEKYKAFWDQSSIIDIMKFESDYRREGAK